MPATVMPIPPSLGQILPFSIQQTVHPVCFTDGSQLSIVKIGGAQGYGAAILSLEIDVEDGLVDVSANGTQEVLAFGTFGNTGLPSAVHAYSGLGGGTSKTPQNSVINTAAVYLGGALLRPGAFLSMLGGPLVLIHDNEELQLGFQNSGGPTFKGGATNFNQALTAYVQLTGQLALIPIANLAGFMALRNAWKACGS